MNCYFCGAPTEEVALMRAGDGGNVGDLLAVDACGACPDTAGLPLMTREEAAEVGAKL